MDTDRPRILPPRELLIYSQFINVVVSGPVIIWGVVRPSGEGVYPGFDPVFLLFTIKYCALVYFVPGAFTRSVHDMVFMLIAFTDIMLMSLFGFFSIYTVLFSLLTGRMYSIFHSVMS